MKPKPLYRSLTFWSGILVMGFICWAWVDSQGHRTTFTFSGDRTHRIVNYLAGIGVLSHDNLSEVTGISRDGGEKGDWFPELRFRETEPISLPNFEASHIPHWLLLLAVALPWSGMLLWRARRIRRAIAGPT